MDGILIIDKPEGWTSHDVVAKVRRIFQTKRVGHTGTLDPFATGVLVVLIGKATRLARFLDKDEKEYEAMMRFGHETDTGDRTGAQTVDCGLRNEEIEDHLGKVDWPSVLGKFTGEIEQTPPMYSAKKIEGRKLYELARQGVAVARQPVNVTIRELEIVGADGSTVRTRVVCSAGTYIRTLAEDIGREIGLGAHLEALRRTRAGRFGLPGAVKIDQLEEANDPASFLTDLRSAVEYLPKFILPPDRVERTRSGLSTWVQDDFPPMHGPLRMMDESGELIAIGYYDAESRAIQPKIVLV
ncbi:MAG TPA: tRNA pseudouridine(55) synthase TruB [Pyrinomonadaceae bacterium]